MKIFKKKLFWIVLILIIAGAAIIYSLGNKKNQTEYTTEKVQRQDLAQSVSATGKVESASETQLNFKVTGRLQSQPVKVGDEVTTGQLLASLEAGQVHSAVANAQAKLLNAQAELNKVMAGYSQEDLAVSDAKVEQAKVALTDSQVSLNNVLDEQENNMLSYKEQTLDSLNNAVFIGNKSLEDIDEFINSSTYYNYLTVYYLSLDTAKTEYNTANADFSEFENIYVGFSTQSSVADLLSILNSAYAALNKIQQALDSTFSLLSVMVPGSNVTQAIIDDNKTTIAADQASLNTTVASVQTAKSNLQNKEIYYNNLADNARYTVEKNLAAVATAQAELNLKAAGPRNFEIDSAQANVQVAQANLQSALADAADYRLIAPFAGTVTAVNYELGEFVSSAKAAIGLMSKSQLEIEVDVPESDIAKINVGDEAQTTLDAFGDERSFAGQVVTVDPASTIINEVVYYKVKINLRETDGVMPGMTANVVIITEKKTQVLTMPLRAVVGKNGASQVRVLVNGQVEEKPVVIGLKGDNGLAEVVSGLNEGEEVITYIKNGSK